MCRDSCPSPDRRHGRRLAAGPGTRNWTDLIASWTRSNASRLEFDVPIYFHGSAYSSDIVVRGPRIDFGDVLNRGRSPNTELIPELHLDVSSRILKSVARTAPIIDDQDTYPAYNPVERLARDRGTAEVGLVQLVLVRNSRNSGRMRRSPSLSPCRSEEAFSGAAPARAVSFPSPLPLRSQQPCSTRFRNAVDP